MGMFSSEDNVAELQNNITNMITQVLATACNANSVSEVDNTFNYLSNSASVNGDYIGAVASGDVTNYCTLTNLSKISTYNQVQNNSDQSNVSVGLMGVIFGAIILIAGIALVLVIVVVLGIGGVFALKSLSGNKEQKDSSPTSKFEEDVQSAELNLV